MGSREEKYIVTIFRDAKTGIAVVEDWRKDQQTPHREGGPAMINRDAATGIVTLEGWFKNGELDRADGPAMINRNGKTGRVNSSAWYKGGQKVAPPRHPRSSQRKKAQGEKLLGQPTS